MADEYDCEQLGEFLQFLQNLKMQIKNEERQDLYEENNLEELHIFYRSF